jgi:hypothetical protein
MVGKVSFQLTPGQALPYAGFPILIKAAAMIVSQVAAPMSLDNE